MLTCIVEIIYSHTMSLFIKNDRIVAFYLTEVKCAKNSKRKAF